MIGLDQSRPEKTGFDSLPYHSKKNDNKGKRLMKNKTSFDSETKAFSYLFAALVTLCTLPVLAWHYWTTLDGFAVLAIGGLAMADCVLWFSSHWSVKTQSGIMRAVSLTVKFSIACVMVFIAALAIMLMRTDHQLTAINKLDSDNHIAEIQARAAAASTLAATPGGRQAAREIAKVNITSSAANLAEKSRATIESRFPGWLLDYGLYVLPPLAAILGALVLSIAAMIVKAREMENQIAIFERPSDSGRIDRLQAIDMPLSDKSIRAWHNGQLVNGADSRLVNGVDEHPI